MCEMVCGFTCGEKYTKKCFHNIYLRRLVLFYSELRLEKIVLQFSKRS